MEFSLIHTALLLASLLFALGVSWICLHLAQRSQAFGDRRFFQLLCLGSPILILSVLGVVIASMLFRGCQHLTPDDSLLSILLLGAAGSVSLVGFVSISWRFCSIRYRLLQLSSAHEDDRTHRILAALCAPMKVKRPTIRRCESDFPVACLVGIMNPEILLSSWMLEDLDDAELEAVLAHELAHLKHRDNLLAWVTAGLKEASFYLPISGKAMAQFKRDREFYSDHLASRMTNKPAALASALLKVWKQGQASTRPFMLQEVGAGFGEDSVVSLEARVHCLLGSSAMSQAPAFSSSVWLVLALGVLLIMAALLPLYLMPSGASSCLLMAI